MKILRLLLTLLGTLLGLAVLLVLVAIAPAVQTWAAQHELADRPGLKGSLGSLSAGFGEVNVEDLHLESNGAVLTLPSLQAKLPLTTVVLGRKLQVRSLVASGWTLDLSQSQASADTAAPKDAILILGSLLRPWNLPFDSSLEDVELEGDVLLPAASGGGGKRMHLRITGGGMGAGREGSFTVESSGDLPGAAESTVDIHGTLAIAMDSPRTFSRMRLSGGISGLGNVSLGALNLVATAEIPRASGEETFSVDVTRGDRQLATVSTHLPTQRGQVAGTWKVKLLDSDLAPFAPNVRLPSIAADGSGTFDADTGFTQVHVKGSLDAIAGRLGAIAPALERLGRVGIGSRFDFTQSGQSIHFASLGMTFAGSRPLASVSALQAFDFDVKTAALALADPHGDWLGVSIVGFPLEWLSGLADGVVLGGGDARGELIVRTENGGFSVRPKGPITAAGVSAVRNGRTLLQGVDLSVPIEAAYGPTGWQLHFAPLTIAHAGHAVARIEARAFQSQGSDQPTTVTGTWSGDLGALTSQPAMPVLDGYAQGTTSGDFTASISDFVDLQGKLRLVGTDPANSISATYHLDLDGGSGVSFEFPLKISTGKTVSDFTAAGTWVGSANEDQIDLKLTGASVALEHLRLLAAPLVAAGSGSIVALTGARDTAPFWGDWNGKVTVELDRLRLATNDLFVVGGVFNIDNGSIRLNAGHGGPEHHNVTNVEGSVSFDPSVANPYSLKATATGFEIEAGPLFKVPHSGEDPMFDGRFSVAPSLSGEGINLEDLIGRSREVFRATSTVGIVRMLRADVASSLHESSALVKDTLGGVGTAVGAVFGVDKHPEFAAKNHLSKSTDAVLDLTNQLAEIGCDLITIVAKRGPDGNMELTSVDMMAPDEFIRGTGRISYAKGVDLLDQPLDLQVEIGARGRVAQLMVTAGLAAPAKDANGFVVVKEPVHFGGSLAHIDGGPWQELLVKAATTPDK
jgi:hypothetical protein